MAKNLKPLSEEDLQSYVNDSVTQAINFVDGEVSPRRLKVMRYYNGEVDIGEEVGRSSHVVTKVRDTVRALLPSIMRAITQSDRPVEFEPRGEEDVILSKQATELVTMYFEKANGNHLLASAAHDALLKFVGFIRWEWVIDETPTNSSYIAITDEQLALLEQDENVTVTEQTSYEIGDPQTLGPKTVHDVTITRIKEEGKLVLFGIPPEEVFADADATCIEDATCFGWSGQRRLSYLMEMGFEWEDIRDLSDGDKDRNSEKHTRTGRSVNKDDAEGDPTAREVTVTEVWIRVDADGDGFAELRHMILGGSNYEILSDENVDEVQVADFRSECSPYDFWPMSVAEMVIQDQDAMSSLMRAIIDNAHATNMPRLAINENFVNVEDAMNGELGAIIRVRQSGQIQTIDVPFTGGQTMPLIDQLNRNSQERTGVSNANLGMDPDALQSTTRAAVAATVSAGTAQIEMLTRNLVNGGLVRLFRGMLRAIVKNSNRPVQFRLNNQWVEMDPRWWHTELDVRVNVGLGTGQPEEKAAAIQMIIQKQEQMLMQFGMDNPFVGWQELRNSYKELLRLAGLRNVTDFFKPIDQQAIAQWQQSQAEAQQQQGQAQQPSPDAAAIVQAETIRTQGRLQGDALKGQTDMAKAKLEDDRKRDEAAMKFALDAAKAQAQHGADINDRAIKREIERDRGAQQDRTMGLNGRGSAQGQ